MAETWESLARCGGLLEDLVRETEETTTSSHPSWALAGAVAVVSTLLGAKIETETGLRTNPYLICVGWSTGGKDAGLATAGKVLKQAGCKALLGPDEVTSGRAVLDSLADEPRLLMRWDEIGDIMVSAKRRPHMEDLNATLKKLKTSQGRRFFKQGGAAQVGKGTKPKHNVGGRAVVEWHNMVILAATEPDSWWDSMTKRDMKGGFLGRLLIVDPGLDHIEKPRTTTRKIIRDEVISQVRLLESLDLHFDREGEPVPRTIPKNGQAQKLFDAWADWHHDMRNQTLGSPDGVYSVYGRSAEHAHQMALVHAFATRGPSARRVLPDDVDWACNFVDLCVKTTTQKATMIGSGVREDDACCEKMADAIHSLTGPDDPWVNMRDIMRKLRWDSAEALRVLAMLKKQKRAEHSLVRGQGRPRNLVRLKETTYQ